MKRLFLFCIISIFPLISWAYNFEVDGIYFNIVSEDDATVEVTYASTSYGSYSGKVTLPETVTYDKEYSVVGVGESAFRKCSGLTGVTMHSGITYIGSRAFYMCSGSSFKTLDLSDTSITNLGENCFFDCERLENIYLPNTLEEVEEDCFSYCTSLSSLDLSSTKVTSLPKYAFSNCYYLTNISLPTTLTSIGDYCFEKCNSVSTIELPEGLETIGKYCFRSCTRLSSMTFPATLTSLGTHCFTDCSALKTFDASKCTNLTEFPDYCFNACTLLESFTPPTNITSLGNWCFQKCTHLTEIDFTSTTLTEMLIYCFDGCVRLESVKMPSCLSRLEQHCFSGCTSLKEIDLSDTQVVNYGSYAFSGCTSLETIGTSPDNLSFGSYCFEDCSSLKAIDFAEYITYVAEGCFSGCTSLTEIELGTWVSIVYDKAFYNCSNIVSFTVLYGYYTTPRTYGTPFEGMNTDECILYVPYGKVSLYAAATNWKEFQHIEQYGENYYNAIVAKANSVSTRFNEVWAIITSYGLADDYQDMYTTITEGIDQILYLAEVRFVNAGLDKSNGERYLSELDQVAEAIEQLLAEAQNEYAHRVATEGMDEVSTLLDETWDTITSEYADVANQFQSDYEELLSEIEALLSGIEEMYENGTLMDNLDDILSQIEALKEKITALLAEAKEEHETTGISGVGATLNEDVQIYTISGIRVDSTTKGEVYVVRRADGTTKKILIK